MKLYVKGQRSTTCVSNVFIDNFMKDANGEFIKVYLYLLRAMSSGMHLSISDVADALDHTQRDIARALNYWERKGLLELTYDEAGELDGLCFIDPATAVKAEAHSSDTLTSRDILRAGGAGFTAGEFSMPATTGRGEPVSRDISAGAGFTEGEFSMPAASDHDEPAPAAEPAGFACPTDENVRELLFIAESYMGRPLSETETNTIMYWYGQMHMSSDLIDYLVGYCVDKGHKSIHYMNRVAISWVDAGITSVTQAKRRNSDYNVYISVVMDSFGISGRNITKAEREYVERWAGTYGFAPELIEEACRRTILTAHTPDFKYAEGILKDWYMGGVSSMGDIQKLDAIHAESIKSRLSVINGEKKAKANSSSPNRFHNFKGREYDFAALENTLLGEN